MILNTAISFSSVLSIKNSFSFHFNTCLIYTHGYQNISDNIYEFY